MQTVIATNEVTFLTGKSLYMNGFIHALKEELSEYNISSINYKQLSLNEKWIHAPDLIIIDIEVATENVELIHFFKSINTKVAIWAFSNEKNLINNMLTNNIDGYFYGPLHLEEIRMAMDYILDGYKYIHPYLTADFLDDYQRLTHKEVKRPTDLLTNREWEILEVMAQGYSNHEIAESLVISEKTVRNHITAILRKLHVKDRINAVLLAISKKWIQIF